MKLRHVMVMLTVAVFPLLALVGCNGDSASLDPVLNWEFAQESDDPINFSAFPAGGALTITLDAEPVGADDQITSYRWSADPDVGFFTSTTTANTIWYAPTVDEFPEGVTALPVTLSVSVETLQGGSTTCDLNLIVVAPEADEP